MKQEKACGCIIIDNNKVLLVKHNKGHWGFPKGHVEKDETEVQTAIREVKEETNIDVEVDESKRYSIKYNPEENITKEVIFFIAKKIGGSIKPQESEINTVEWFDFEEALEVITYDNSKELLKNYLENFKNS